MMNTPNPADPTGGWCSPPRCVVFEGHHYARTSCSQCWPYWGERLERTALRRQCDDLHAHQPHSWQFPAQPTFMCPGRWSCHPQATTIDLRELPPREPGHGTPH